VDRVQPFSFRVSEASRAAIHKAAEKAGMTDSEWVRLVVEAAAGVSELPEQLVRVVTYERRRKVRDGKW
jgi:antitoxin component of RelBE/YafQ-DinJ toxin-antitoxin module